ncbi:MAG: heavy-metal-associated domain-containing protein [Clostridia bacterium]|nr:heavy-metal-associated domain-containing protein [Clostridia bacterium]
MKKTYKIKGMTCDSCVQLLTESLLADVHISEAEVSLEKNEAAVTFDEKKQTDKGIRKIVEDCGFTISDSIGRKIIEWLLFAALFFLVYNLLLRNSDFNILTVKGGLIL